MHKSRRGDPAAEAQLPCCTRPERICDLAVHLAGIGLAAVALPPLLVLGVQAGMVALIGLSLYAVGLVAMLTFSALYWSAAVGISGHPNADGTSHLTGPSRAATCKSPPDAPCT